MIWVFVISKKSILQIRKKCYKLAFLLLDNATKIGVNPVTTASKKSSP